MRERVMRWQGRRGSSNIEDRRRSPARTGGGLGIIGVLLVLGLGYFFGIDVSPLLQGGGGGQANQQGAELTEPADQRVGQFVTVTLAIPRRSGPISFASRWASPMIQ